jgi:signal peptidase II
MIALSMTLLLVLVSDQAVKLLLRRAIGPDAVGLGPFGTVRMVAGRLWLGRLGRRLGAQSSGAMILGVWVAAAVPLVIVSAWIPSLRVFAGLVLGGSLSHAVESSVQGSISDYICLRFWPAFNLADLAIAAGAVGILIETLLVIRGVAS